MLAAVPEVHGRGLGAPQASVPVAASRGRREQEHSPRGGLELEVDVGLVGWDKVLEGLDGLVVLENLHGGYVVRGDVARGDAVAALEQVHAVDGEARYGLGLVEYLPVVPDRDAGQLAEHVLDDQVLLGTEGCYVVGYGVVALHLHLRSSDRHLVQLEEGLLHLEVVPPADIVYGAAHGLDAHAGDSDDHAVGFGADAEGVVPLSVGGGVAYGHPVLRPADNDVAYCGLGGAGVADAALESGQGRLLCGGGLDCGAEEDDGQEGGKECGCSGGMGGCRSCFHGMVSVRDDCYSSSIGS